MFGCAEPPDVRTGARTFAAEVSFARAASSTVTVKIPTTRRTTLCTNDLLGGEGACMLTMRAARLTSPERDSSANRSGSDNALP